MHEDECPENILEIIPLVHFRLHHMADGGIAHLHVHHAYLALYAIALLSQTAVLALHLVGESLQLCLERAYLIGYIVYLFLCGSLCLEELCKTGLLALGIGNLAAQRSYLLRFI